VIEEVWFWLKFICIGVSLSSFHPRLKHPKSPLIGCCDPVLTTSRPWRSWVSPPPKERFSRYFTPSLCVPSIPKDRVGPPPSDLFWANGPPPQRRPPLPCLFSPRFLSSFAVALQGAFGFRAETRKFPSTVTGNHQLPTSPCQFTQRTIFFLEPSDSTTLRIRVIPLHPGGKGVLV